MNNNNLNEQLLPLQEKTILQGEQLLNDGASQKEKSRKKQNSALVAASVARSAVGHAKSHVITNKPGDFAHSGTNISYED